MMRRIHHLSAGVSALVLLISLSGPWFSFQVPSGASFSLTGLEASALGSTLVGVAAASYGAALLTRGLIRRGLGVLQALGGVAIVATWYGLLDAPAHSAQSTITALTGLAGSGALDTVVVTGPSVFFILGVVGAFIVAVSGVCGTFSAEAPQRATRYERNHTAGGASDPVQTWDDLSEGHDPTKR
jgi:uncharacterized membrane protein (TIGR02234 family)